MSYNGSGTFVINSTGQPVVTGTVISSSTFNSLTADLGTGLSTAITKDGQTTTTALIPFAAGVSSTLATDATSISTGSLLTSGGLGVTKAAWIGGLMNVAGAATFQSSVSISGVVTFTGLTFTLDLKSNTAFATPSALSATGYRAFASTVSGAAMMGFGTTNDVSLMNRAGTVVLGVGPNTTLVNIPAALTVGTTLAVTGAGTFSSTLGVTGTSTLAAVNASGNVTVAVSGMTSSVKIGQNSGASTYGLISFNGIMLDDGTGMNIGGGGGVDKSMYFNVATAGTYIMRVANTAALTLTATSTTLSGTLGVTGTSTLAAVNAANIIATGNTPKFGSGAIDFFLYGGTTSSPIFSFSRYDTTAANRGAKIQYDFVGAAISESGGISIYTSNDTSGGTGLVSRFSISSAGAVTIPGTLGVTGTSTLGVVNIAGSTAPLSVASTGGGGVFKFYPTDANDVTIQLGDAHHAGSAKLILVPSSTKYNWAILSNWLAADVLDFAPSTAQGGSTFTTSVLRLATTGASITGTLGVTGVISQGAGPSAAAGNAVMMSGASAKGTWATLQKNTQNVSTATSILTSAMGGGGTAFVIVVGNQVSGAGIFIDTLVWSDISDNLAVLSSSTMNGSPGARTYSLSGQDLTVAFATQTFDINAKAWESNDPD